ncbi:hypothetical protein NK553_08125 [Pseudomonas sp. ZM23]|uniref:Tol-pal system protein YbgF n=1 Tax=Pseudomonas triclosanedens TaxID=2961893 RepID=A0ABY7A0F3_9PSED|nr:hypothetical protein [Pseudomonas triclosanedens]MCP8463907.1 hypothetical protein [Pseudomonas triclosanedens]MCP8468991.1 hypothetical protein [Pseudomonas triclosanedens]MCP8475713.1 hypothetical protein [Pseudomonas triclosanedens]WAI50573.1 hypothetical protein OU419_04725 [Pseudomonas triclosanedens]
MRLRTAILLAALSCGVTLPTQAAMKLGNFTDSGALLVADTFDSEVIHKSRFSSDDLQRMTQQLEQQQRTLQEQARQIDSLKRQLEDQSRALDDLKRSR